MDDLGYDPTEGEERFCASCRHALRGEELSECVCAERLREGVAHLRGAQKWSPRWILAALDDAVVDEADSCECWEED